MISGWLKDLPTTAVGVAVNSVAELVYVFLQDGTTIIVSSATGLETSRHQVAVNTPVRSACAIGNGDLVLLQADGTLTIIDSSDLDQPSTSFIVPGIEFPGQIVGSGEELDHVFIVNKQSSSEAALLEVRTSDGATLDSRDRSFLTGVASTVDDRARIVLASNTSQWERGRVEELDATAPSAKTDMPRTGRVCYGTNGRSVIVVHPEIACVTLIELQGDASTTFGPFPSGIVEVLPLSDGRLVLLSPSELSVIDSLSDLGNHVYVESPAPIFHGSWGRIFFELGTDPFDVESIDFIIPAGPTAGFVSYSKEHGKGRSVPILVGGGLPGKYDLELRDRSSGTLITSTVFFIVSQWDHGKDGPPGYYHGPALRDSGAGSGPDRPENIGTVEHIGEWKVLLLMVNTSTASWPTATLDADRTSILEHVSTGFDVSGVRKSAKQYYEENSGHIASPAQGLTITVHNDQVFGPVTISQSWDDLFEQEKDKDGNITDKRWMSKGTSFTTIILQALNDGIASTSDFQAVNVVITVPVSPDALGGVGSRFVWPHARYTRQTQVDTDSTRPKHNLAQTWVPLDFASHDTDSGLTRFMFATLSHELGHTLDLPDVYAFDSFSQAIKDRVTSDWELMAGSRNTLPHFSISNKMRQGWVSSGQIRMFNFSGSRAVNEVVRIEASELESIPSGAIRAVELRLGGGWDYYIEYRAVQAGFISDQITPTRQVVITDVTNDDFSSALSRPPILLVRKDSGQGPLLDVGKHMEETDPGTRMDLKVEALTEGTDHATVRVVYGSNGKPELGIRPWRGAATNWQSPDIEVQNLKSAAEPEKYGNVPWLGHDNTVIARVRNNGDLLAVGVVVHFTVLEFTSGHDGPEERLGSDKQDVPPGSEVVFTAPDRWAPPDTANKHYCIVVRIELYQDPTNPMIFDKNIFNNEARSNYMTFVSATSSPASRVGTAIHLANPFDTSTTITADISQTSTDHRIFTSHQYLRVDGRSSRQIQIWDEALLDTPEWNQDRKKDPVYKAPNNISIRGYANVPYPSDCKTPMLTGGAGISVFAGRATVIKIRGISRADVSGQVLFVDDGRSVGAGGKILVEMLPITTNDRREWIGEDVLNSDGFFAFKYDRVKDRPELKEVIVHYLGTFGAAPSETERLSVPT